MTDDEYIPYLGESIKIAGLEFQFINHLTVNDNLEITATNGSYYGDDTEYWLEKEEIKKLKEFLERNFKNETMVSES